MDKTNKNESKVFPSEMKEILKLLKHSYRVSGFDIIPVPDNDQEEITRLCPNCKNEVHSKTKFCLKCRKSML